MSDLLKYKGFSGTVEYSADDHCLFGTVQHIVDKLVYTGDSPDEIKAAFESAIDDYLAFCARTGREPNKPFNGVFQVRLAPPLHRELACAAIEESKTLNALVEFALQSYIAGRSEAVNEDTASLGVSWKSFFEQLVNRRETHFTEIPDTFEPSPLVQMREVNIYGSGKKVTTFMTQGVSDEGGACVH